MKGLALVFKCKYDAYTDPQNGPKQDSIWHGYNTPQTIILTLFLVS